MALSLFSRRSTNTTTRFRWIFQLILVVAVIIVSAQDSWGPYVTNWRCQRITAQLKEQYGIIVQYGDPSEFYIPPETSFGDKSEKYLSVKPANKYSALIALKGVRAALEKYPKNLLHQYLEAVFIAEIIKNRGNQLWGTYFQSWIYISATPDGDSYGPSKYEETLHHELSSLIMNGDKSVFPAGQWCAVNGTNFIYLINRIDMTNAAAVENSADPSNAPLWYKAGFVDDYGMSDMENDFNTYAELAMTQPEKLRRLTKQYPKIKEKTRILVDFYSSLAPELAAYFKKCGLTESVAK